MRYRHSLKIAGVSLTIRSWRNNSWIKLATLRATMAGGFEVPYFVSPWMSEPDEIGDAVTGFWNEVGMKTKLFSDSYAGVYRPMIVARTASQPWLVVGYDGPLAPFDFPRGLLNTTLVHGGASFGAESALFDDLFTRVSAEPDLETRRELMTEIIDYMTYWVLNPAYVFQPNLVAINPKQISSWELYRDNQEKTFNNLSSIIPARLTSVDIARVRGRVR